MTKKQLYTILFSILLAVASLSINAGCANGSCSISYSKSNALVTAVKDKYCKNKAKSACKPCNYAKQVKSVNTRTKNSCCKNRSIISRVCSIFRSKSCCR